jgi:hypothetical protein
MSGPGVGGLGSGLGTGGSGVGPGSGGAGDGGGPGAGAGGAGAGAAAVIGRGKRIGAVMCMIEKYPLRRRANVIRARRRSRAAAGSRPAAG